MNIFILLTMEMDFPSKELFTVDSLSTLIGLTGMVYVSSNALQQAFNYNPKWLALIIAQFLSIISIHFAIENISIIDYIIAIFNGFLVFLTSAGATNASSRINSQNQANSVNKELPNTLKRRKFNSSWWS